MSASLLAVSIDCADAGRLAEFWSRILDRPVDPDPSPDFAAIGMDGAASGGLVWMFHRVPEAAQPKQAKNRVHADLVSGSLEKSVAAALEYGATRLGDFDESGFVWTSLADPEGNEFDIVAAPQ